MSSCLESWWCVIIICSWFLFIMICWTCTTVSTSTSLPLWWPPLWSDNWYPPVMKYTAFLGGGGVDWMPPALVSLAKQGQIILHQPGVLADYLHLTWLDVDASANNRMSWRRIQQFSLVDPETCRTWWRVRRAETPCARSHLNLRGVWQKLWLRSAVNLAWLPSLRGSRGMDGGVGVPLSIKAGCSTWAFDTTAAPCADPVLVLAGDNNPNYVRLKLGKMIIWLENVSTIQTWIKPIVGGLIE